MAEEVDVTSGVRTEEFYNNFMDNDNLSSGWVLVNSPIPVCAVLVIYMFLIYIGPHYMKTRPPIKMKTTLRLYNIIQVVCNGYLTSQVLFTPQLTSCIIELSCSLENEAYYRNLRPKYLQIAWLYLLLKMFDLFDTVFMVFRKKNTHITFLHVYHHTAMVFFVWLNFKYTKPFHAILPVMFNMSVHAIMYSYYFLTTFARLQTFLNRWKRNITQLQMAQFVFALFYVPLLYINGCPISRVFTFTCTFNASIFFVLFLNFYIKAYTVKYDT